MRTFGADELSKRVDEVLFYVWDPINVSPEPYARGEYENYVPAIVHLLDNDHDADSISGQLLTIVKTNMGLPGSKQHCDEVADLLLLHKKAIRDGCA